MPSKNAHPKLCLLHANRPSQFFFSSHNSIWLGDSIELRELLICWKIMTIFSSLFFLVRPSLQSCDVSAYQAIFSLLVSSYGWLHKHWCREEDVSEIDKGCVECCPRCRFKSKTSMPIMRHQTKISSLAHTQNCVCVCVIALDSGGGKNLANNSYLRWTYIRW